MRETRPGGFITLHRQFWTSPDLTGLKAAHLHVFVTILNLANWKDDFFWCGASKVEVRRGELAHSIRTIAKESRATEREARTTISNLLARGVLQEKTATPSDTRVRVLRVVNYDKFQGIPARGDTRGDRPPTDHRHDSDTAPSLREEDKQLEPYEPNSTPTPTAPVLTLASPSKLERRAQKRTGGHPRHQGLVALVTDTFRDVTGSTYGFRPVDARKVSDLLALGDDSEIAERWKRALTHQGFPTVRSLTELVTNWNRFGGTEPQTKATSINAPAGIGQNWGGPPPF